MLFSNPEFYAKTRCKATGVEFVSNFTPERRENIVTPEYWESDLWDPLDYGKEYDYKQRGFFDQFFHLYGRVPLPGAPSSISNENCPYSWSLNSKNCYFLSMGGNSENVYYSTWVIDSHDILESGYVFRSHDSAYCMDIQDSHGCSHLEFGRFCTDCHYSINLENCSFCIFSTNLRGKKYYIHNRPVTPEVFEKYKREVLQSGSYKKDLENKNILQELRKTAILKDALIVGSENCSGDRIKNCRDCNKVFDAEESENCHYSLANWYGKNCLDASPV